MIREGVQEVWEEGPLREYVTDEEQILGEFLNKATVLLSKQKG